MLKYKILSRLGAGGMGEVYLAKDLDGDREVAVKILQPQFSSSNDSQERFLREMKINASLDHPNIIHVFDYGESDGTLYFVMEYVKGTSLKEVVEKGPMDVHDAVDRVEEIARALEYIHPRELIHRDLKPANIMLTEQGKAVLLDFGLVKALAEISLTMTGKVIGTPRYMAPEMMVTGKVDHRSDIYQLGCIFYELCTGQFAVPGKTRKEVAETSLYEVPIPPSEHSKEVDPDLENLILNTLEKNPAERYQDAPGLLRDIQSYKNGDAIPRRGSGKPARQRNSQGRRRRTTTGMQAVPAAHRRAVAGSQSAASGSLSGSVSSSASSPSSGGGGRRGSTGGLAAPAGPEVKDSVTGGMVAPRGLPGPPAGPGTPSSSASRSLTGPSTFSHSLDREGLALPSERLETPSAIHRAPPPPSLAEQIASGGEASTRAVLAGVVLATILLVFLWFSFAGPRFTVRGLAVREIYAGADVSWESQRPYVSRVEVWSQSGGAPRVFASETSNGLLHLVKVRGLEPKARMSFRVLLPDGSTAEGREFTPLDLDPSEPEFELNQPFEGTIKLSLGEVGARVIAEDAATRQEIFDSQESWSRHTISLPMPGDGSSMRLNLLAVRSEDQKVTLFRDQEFPGVSQSLRNVLGFPEGKRAGPWRRLVVPLRLYLGDPSRSDPWVKMWIYQALQPVRERAFLDRVAGQTPEFDPETVFPGPFQVSEEMASNQSYEVEMETRAPLISFVDPRDLGPSLHAKVTGVIRNLPPSLVNARGAGIEIDIARQPREASILKVELAGIGEFSFFLGKGSSRELGNKRIHRFDPRLLSKGGDLEVTCRFERMGKEKPRIRSVLMLQGGMRLAIQN